METLSHEQTLAFNAVREGKNVFLTGGGGTGKTYLIDTIYRQMPRLRVRETGLGVKVCVTALTGCAAILLGSHAKTVHSWAGIGLGKDTVEKHVAMIRKNGRAKKNWAYTDILIIDEISMMPPDLFEKLDKIGRIMRRCHQKPFGGIQVVLCGDFLQLPPVMKGSDLKFCFESSVWNETVEFEIELKDIHRQTDDTFRKILSEARIGALSKESVAILDSRTGLNWKRNRIRPTLLFPRRAEVDAINEANLKALGGEKHCFKAGFALGPDAPPKFNVRDEDFLNHVRRFDKDSMYDAELDLVVGAQVMLLTNLDFTRCLVNGSRGVITEFIGDSTHYPVVEFMTGEKVTVGPAQWEIDDYKDVFRTQIPLKLAYAVTIHKCVSEDTLLSLPGKGLIKIKELECKSQEKNTVYSPGNLQVSGMCEIKDIIEVYKGEMKDGIKFTSTFGFEITTSVRHPLLIFNKDTFMFEWKKAPTITKDDYIVLKKGAKVEGTYFPLNSVTFTKPYSKIIKVPEYLNEEFGYFLGVMLGDGSINPKTYRFDLLGIDMDILDRCVDILETQFNIKIEQRQCKGRKTITNRIFFHSKQLVELFKFIGYNFQKADKKEIPDCILKSPISVQKTVIQGLFDTDGGVSKSVINFTTTSDVMGKQIQQIIFNMNIPVSRTMMRDNVIEKNWKAVYRLNMSGKSALKFVTDIGFTCKRKKDMSQTRFYEKATARKNSKSQSFEIPNGSGLITKLRNEMRFGLKRIKSDRITLPGNQILSSIVNKTQKLRCDSLNVIINEINNISQYPTGKLLSFIHDNGILIDSIKYIEHVSNVQMYDIGVSPLNTSGFLPDGHDFIGNGFINHNCQGSTLDCALIDIGANIFEYGQAYVALSRVRSLEGLYIHQFDPDAIVAHPRVLTFYEEMRKRVALGATCSITTSDSDPVAPDGGDPSHTINMPKGVANQIVVTKLEAHNNWLYSTAPEEWRPVLARKSDALQKLCEWLEGKEFLPPREDVWNALRLVEPDRVRVVILGQDPYPTPGHAHGLAFSVKEGIAIAPSLRNIFKELESDVGVKRVGGGGGCLEDWAVQGVLMLNTVLTVEPGKPQSHSKIGWEEITDAILTSLRGRKIVFVLWGKVAQAKKKLLEGETVWESAHPSPLSAHSGFFGSKPFSAINRLIGENGLGEPIRWG